MKYIIDVPDEVVGFMNGEMSFFVEPKIKDERRRHYVLRIDEEDVSMDAKPYTEPDRKDIEEEVWKLADNIHGMSIQDKMSCFGFSLTSAVTSNLSYQEAKTKYEAWKKKDKIHVGDEIYSDGDYEKSVAMEIHGDGSVSVYTKNGCIEHWWNKMHNLKKTGRHFDEVVQLLKKIRGEEE